MGICPDEKMNSHVQRIINGTHEFPPRCSNIRLVESTVDAATHSYCLDVFPVLDEASIPVTSTCQYGSLEGEDPCNFSGVPERGHIIPQSPPQLDFLSFLEVPHPTEQCLDVHWNCRDYIDLQVESSEKSSCGVDIQVSDECPGTPKTNDEILGSPVKSEGVLHSALSTKSSLHLGGKIMQLLVDQSTMLLKWTSRDKCNNERVHDTTPNKWRKYKRSTSFNSRKIVLFSSILSSMGTMVLIYLTLRVKQIGDGLVHV